MVSPLEWVLRSSERKLIKNLNSYVSAVNLLEDDFRDLSDSELKNKTVVFKERLANGENIDQLIPEAFATVREASDRVLGKRHYDVQVMGATALHLGNIAEIATGEGKSLSVNTKMITHDGIKKAGDIKIGDYLYDRKGLMTKVTGVYPQGLLKTFKVILEDGRTILCNDEHLWNIYHNNSETQETVTTQSIIEKLKNGEKIALPVNYAVRHDKVQYYYHPYLVGALLSKVFHKKETGYSFKNLNLSVIDKVKGNVQDNMLVQYHDENENDSVVKNAVDSDSDRFIPVNYKYGDVSQRFLLLLGLFDNFSEIPDRTITVYSEKLYYDIKEVFYSLGLSVHGNMVKGGYSLSVDFDFPAVSQVMSWEQSDIDTFLIKHHQGFVNVVNVVELEDKVEQVCFSVDNDEKLFLAGDYVVTHNTLVATMPAYLNALTGKGVHVVTVNDYLAEYQAELMGRIYHYLGLSSGVILTQHSPQERKMHYNADITYGTNNEFGFDFLRDNMVQDISQKVQRGHHYAIVDEVDSILIDEARTPLIISAPAHGEASSWYNIMANIVKNLKPGVDYEFDEKQKTVGILESGIDIVEDSLGIDNLYSNENAHLVSFVNNALKARQLFEKDKEYVVENGKVQIVDEHTGRILDGRRYNDGLHQAIEAKENVKVEPENKTMATITLQNYFRMYEKLSGMTGTAESEAAELMSTYNLNVVSIPTNKGVHRIDKTDLIYKNEIIKFNAVAQDIKNRVEKGQPVLVGTTSVEKSEYLSKLLSNLGIKHDVLNAKNHAKEAHIIAKAGLKNSVTVATNMAGRGTDILLGGNPEFEAVEHMKTLGLDADSNEDEYNEKWAEVLEEFENKAKIRAEEIKELGGLYVLGTERHESRRIDNQLRGRAGRQGDPGESRFYLSLTDDLMRLFNSQGAMRLMDNAPDDTAIDSKIVSKVVQSAQAQVEGRNAEQRKNILKYDDVLSRQREVFYKDRDKVLSEIDTEEYVKKYINEIIISIIEAVIGKNHSEDWDWDKLIKELRKIYPVSIKKEDFIEEFGNINNIPLNKAIEEFILDAQLQYQDREDSVGADTMRTIERRMFLRVMDNYWPDHLYEMEYLKEGIGLRALAQKDPLVEYQKEGSLLFISLMEAMREEIISKLFYVDLSKERVNPIIGAHINQALPDGLKAIIAKTSNKEEKVENLDTKNIDIIKENINESETK